MSYQPIFPSFQKTARVGADGNLADLCLKAFEPNPNASGPEDPPGPERTDLLIYATHSRTNAQIQLAYDDLEGAYCPTGGIAVEAGDEIEIHIPATNGFAPNTVFVEVQPAS